MVLILSNSFDLSTSKVIEYLELFGKKYIRINENDDLSIEFLGQDFKIYLNSNKYFYFSELDSFWYRRGVLNFDFLKNTDINELDDFCMIEHVKIIEYIYYKFSKLKSLNDYYKSDVNKLIISDMAKKIGLSTPTDFIFQNEFYVKNLKKTHKSEFISKSISGIGIIKVDNFSIFNYTKIIENTELKSANFFPSLFQNYIEKKYELRVFYLEGEFYSMAIFSQNDDQTKIDFRDYNLNQQNRRVPFKLPKEIEIKLDLLMRKININSGSIDIIVTNENEYVFLEVNPVGQFGMVSNPCNYNIYKKIANFLSSFEYETN